MLLVQKSTAKSFELVQHLEDEMQNLKYESDLLKNITPTEILLSDSELAKFHSSWVYSAVRQLTAISQYQTVSQLSSRLQIAEDSIIEILNFLVSSGLCKVEQDKYSPGVRHTHLPDDSPYLIQRQSNWRLKAIERMPHKKQDEIFYTSCLTISKKDVQAVRKELMNSIAAIRKIVDPSESEESLCINIDCFRF